MEVEKNQKFEKITKPISGYLVLIVLFVIIALIIYGVVVIQKPFVVVNNYNSIYYQSNYNK